MATVSAVNFDVIPLEFATNLSTTEGTVYTCPTSEAGVRVSHVSVTNKTSSAVLYRLAYRDVNNDFGDGANTDYYIAYDCSIPANGLPVYFDFPTLMSSASPAAIRMKAGTATALDVCIWGIAMKDT